MLLLVSLVLFDTVVAQAPTPAPANSRLLTAEKMWALKRLGDPAITPDGIDRRGAGDHVRRRARTRASPTCG